MIQSGPQSIGGRGGGGGGGGGGWEGAVFYVYILIQFSPQGTLSSSAVI